MKKTKKFKNKIEISMNADELLEFLTFFKNVRNDGTYWSPSAEKAFTQVREAVIARIEGRATKPYIKTTDDLVMEIDQKKLQKLAFTPTALDSSYAMEKFNVASAEEIVKPNPKIHNIPSKNDEPNVQEIGAFQSSTDEHRKMYLKPVVGGGK